MLICCQINWAWFTLLDIRRDFFTPSQKYLHAQRFESYVLIAVEYSVPLPCILWGILYTEADIIYTIMTDKYISVTSDIVRISLELSPPHIRNTAKCENIKYYLICLVENLTQHYQSEGICHARRQKFLTLLSWLAKCVRFNSQYCVIFNTTKSIFDSFFHFDVKNSINLVTAYEVKCLSLILYHDVIYRCVLVDMHRKTDGVYIRILKVTFKLQ